MVRASAVGSCYALSRLSTAALPFALLPVLDHAGSTVVLVVLALAMLICALDVALLGPTTTGQPLEILSPATRAGNVVP